MPDSPDYSKYQPGSVRFSLQDMGELAVRLGSPDTYDRRGEVIGLCDFSDGIAQWRNSISGTGAAVDIIASETEFSPYALKLTGGTTNSKYAQVSKTISPYNLGKLGVECHIAFNNLFDNFVVVVDNYDGVNIHTSGVKINNTTKSLTYIDHTNTDVKIDTIPVLYTLPTQYNSIKMVADYGTREYIRLLFNQNEYDLSGISFYTAANAGVVGTIVSIFLFSTAAPNAIARLSSVILTANEK